MQNPIPKFRQNSIISEKPALREKCPNTEGFSGPYVPVFGLNMEIYSVNLRIQ